ncbi:uncharacterized protein LOC143606690 [Bidens hawaiensis]|uniref:uncharacterized protein LOC143606690 n=1 Tax=Bidens hawaiensis TaxID=980011 RepID=UPI0040491844
MWERRQEPKKKARKAGHIIGNKEDKLDIICEFPPKTMSRDIWRSLCLGWSLKKWQNKSPSGRNNRANADNRDYISRHTSGSMGFEERRIYLEKKYGRKITWLEMFFHTHLTKECKTIFWAGELDIHDWEEFEFCTDRSKETYADYMRNMIELYGSDLSQHPAGDLDVWAKVQPPGGSRSRKYGT